MAQNFKKLMKRFNKLPLLCKIAGIVVLALVIKLLVDCLSRKVEGMSNPKELIYFYWDKCGHCKDFTPIWDEFVQKYQGPLTLKKLETKEAGDLIKKYNIKGYPTVVLVDEQGQHKEFDGERTVQGLEVFTK
jgi:thioredoxin-like negative regulator of GroEL|tara:strand:- start:130 stop:525 length:396 start_codon:yes stop_codon:yes gene_type:complete